MTTPALHRASDTAPISHPPPPPPLGGGGRRHHKSPDISTNGYGSSFLPEVPPFLEGVLLEGVFLFDSFPPTISTTILLTLGMCLNHSQLSVGNTRTTHSLFGMGRRVERCLGVTSWLHCEAQVV